MTKRPTIHDVAQRAGVSKSLVALVFKQDSGVSTARRERVLRAAEELGYTPNAWARTLRSNTGGFVGIIVADFHNPIFTEIADLTRQALASQGIFSFVATASYVDGPDGKAVDPAPIQHLLDLKPSSLFIVGGLPNHKAFTALSRTLPIVVALASAADLPLAVAVRSDDNDAMRQLCAHLHQLGHHEVGYVGPRGRLVADDRLNAFLRQAKIAGLAARVESTGSDYDEAAGNLAATKLLGSAENAPSAIIAYNDNVAFGVQEAVANFSNETRRDVAVTGYDNTYIAQLERIGLTSVEQEKAEIANRVCCLLTNPDLYEQYRGREILITPRVVLRKSSLQPSSNRN